MAEEAVASLIWTIENFEKCPDCWMESPVFKAKSSVLRLKLQPFGDLRERGFLSLILVRCQTFRSGRVRVKCRVSVVDVAGTNAVSKTGETPRYDVGSGVILRLLRLIELQRLQVEERDVLLPGGAFTVRCDVLSLEEEPFDFKSEADEREAELFSNRLAGLLESGAHSDIELLSSDGERFKVHRIILEIRWSFLYQFLKAGDASEYRLDRVEASTLRAILGYVYTGTLDAGSINLELLRAMDRYQLLNFTVDDLCPPIREVVKAVSTIRTSELKFRWSIKGFGELKPGQSGVYPAYCLTRNKWDKMVIACRVNLFDNTNAIVTFLPLENSEIGSIRGKVTISQRKCLLQEREFYYLFESSFNTYYNLELKGLDTITRSKDECLDLYFDISMTKRGTDDIQVTVTVESETHPGGMRNVKELQEDFWHSNYFDVESRDTTLCFKCGSIKSFRVHRAILCARSPAFTRMFEKLGSENKEVHIEDVDPITMRDLLLYVYIGDCSGDMGSEQAKRLYVAAIKYELPFLKERCVQILKTCLLMHDDLAGELLSLAYEHEDEDLKKILEKAIADKP